MAAAVCLVAAAANVKAVNKTLKVDGKCNMCKANIEKAAKSIQGVKVAEWNKDSKVLRLRFDDDKAKIESISQAIAQAGYDTDKDKAPTKTYDALPGCCKYR